MVGVTPSLDPRDPLGFSIDCPHHAVFHPLGYPVSIAATTPEVLRAAEESWGAFAPRRRTADHDLRVRVIVAGGPPFDADLAFHAQQHLFTAVAGPANLAICDFRQGAAFCWVTTGTVADRPSFRYHFLETVVYTLLTDAFLAPVHASCVSRNGRGVLFCGESGAGKSTLAFACGRSGWEFVSDDAVFLVRDEADRIVLGRPHQVRLHPSATALFPDLAGRLPRQRPNGKMTIEVATAEFPGIGIATECAVDYVLFLDRREAAEPALLPMAAAEALVLLEQGLAPFGEAWPAHRARSLRRLLSVPAYRFRYGGLDGALAELERLLAR